MSDKSVYYIVGDDPASRSKDLVATVDSLIGNEDKSICVETFDLADAESEEQRLLTIENAVNSLLSPPFLSPMRVVIIRDIGSASTEEVQSLINYLDNPTENVFLVAVQGGGRISVALTKKWKPYVIEVGTTRETIEDVFSRMSKEKKLDFEPGVRNEILKKYGQDTSKLVSLFERLENVYGQNAKLSLEQIDDYIGESGNVAVYELANKIISGEKSESLEILSRMLHSTSAQNSKPMHPLQIIALISGHFRKLALLDDVSIRNQNDAHIALGSKGSPYAAKKNWEQSKRLGSDAIISSIEILGAVDSIVKGANAVDAEIAIELGVVSLCQICMSTSSSEHQKITNSFIENLYV